MGHGFGILGKGGNAGLSGASAPRRTHIQSPFSLGQPALKDGCASVSHKVVASRLRAVPLGQQCHWEERSLGSSDGPSCPSHMSGPATRPHLCAVTRTAGYEGSRNCGRCGLGRDPLEQVHPGDRALATGLSEGAPPLPLLQSTHASPREGLALNSEGHF